MPSWKGTNLCFVVLELSHKHPYFVSDLNCIIQMIFFFFFEERLQKYLCRKYKDIYPTFEIWLL